jgi:RES domain-containing protein
VAAPSKLTRFGDDFVRRGEHCLLLVPSALAPAENNWLLNPQHHSVSRIVVRELEPLNYDPRTFRRPGRR